MWRGWFIRHRYFFLSLSLPLYCPTIATIITIVADFSDLLLLNSMVSACHYHRHYHNWIHKLVYPYHMHLPICALATVKSITPTYFIIRERTQSTKLYAISQQMELSLWLKVYIGIKFYVIYITLNIIIIQLICVSIHLYQI